MLIDHAVISERLAKKQVMRDELPEAFGEFLVGLAQWDWFLTITFRKETYSSAAMKGIGEWLADIQAQAGGRCIGWSIQEEFGALGGRLHCHGLVSKVSHLRRRFWWAEAYRRFGRTRIEPINRERAVAFYAAKYAAKALGKIHFGGTLAGVESSRVVRCQTAKRLWRVWDDSPKSSEPVATHAIVAPSAELERGFFRLGLVRRNRG